jgi:hypothetical protein
MRHILSLALLSLLAVPVGAQSSRHFDGTNDHVSCGDIDAFDGLDNLTVFAWARLDDDDGAFGGLFTKWTANTATDNSWALAKNDTEKASFVIIDTAQRSATGATTFSTGVWNCFVGTYNRADPETLRLRVYLNGVQDGTAAGTDASTKATAIAVGAGRNRTFYWDGQIAHAGADTRTWSALEVAEYCRGNLVVAQRAALYMPLWDPEATPGTYRSTGSTSAACSSTTNHPAVSSDGPPVFFPGGGQSP